MALAGKILTEARVLSADPCEVHHKNEKSSVDVSRFFPWHARKKAGLEQPVNRTGTCGYGAARDMRRACWPGQKGEFSGPGFFKTACSFRYQDFCRAFF